MNRMWSLLLMLLMVAPACALPSTDQRETAYRLIHSDSVAVRRMADEYVTTLMGHVHLFYGSTEFFSDQAEVFHDRKMARMNGNIKVHDDTLHLKADEATWFQDEQKLFLRGNVKLRENHRDNSYRTFDADKLTWQRKARQVISEGRVRGYDSRDSLNALCGYSEYRIDTGYGFMIKDPMAWRSGRDSMFISAQKIEFFHKDRKVVATFDVKTKSRDFDTTSDFLLYFAEPGEAVFLGQPRFYSRWGDARAREFHIWSKDRMMERAVLQDSCRVDFISAEGDSSKINLITSDYMEFFFENGAVRKCIAENNVFVNVAQSPSADNDYFHNNATGNRLEITINAENDVETVVMRGGVKGRYRFRKD